MRTAFIQQLTEEAKANPRIFLLVGDLGYSVIEEFANLFPDRYLNVGIAEQNMTGIAAGLSMEGYIVYTYSIGNFPTLRAMEQIRYDICYHNLNVKIIAVGGGYAYGPLGASHHATEELGMLRTLPNLVVCAPGDPEEAKLVTMLSAKHYGPCYIRLGKAGEPRVHKQNTLSAHTIGDILNVTKGQEIAVFSTGSTLNYVKEFLQENNLTASIYSFPFLKPINKNALLEVFLTYSKIITIEEHQANGGFGSTILEHVNDLKTEGFLKITPSILRIAIQDHFHSISGTQQHLREMSNIVLKKEYFEHTSTTCVLSK